MAETYDKRKTQDLLRMEMRFQAMPAFEHIRDLTAQLKLADAEIDNASTAGRKDSIDLFELRRVTDGQREDIKKLNEGKQTAEANLKTAVTTLTAIASDARGAKPKALQALNEIGMKVESAQPPTTQT